MKEDERLLRATRLPAFGLHDGATVRLCSEELAEMFGASDARDLVGKDVLQLIAPEAHDDAVSAIQAEEHKPHRSTGLRADGQTFPMEFSCTTVRYGSTTGRLFTIRDLSPVALIVDDDGAVMRLTASLMRVSGYQVIARSGSREALADFAPGVASVVISDIVMPDMNGVELISAMREHDPDLPAILVSGYTEQRAPEDAKTIFVKKPFTSRHLEKALKRLPERARAPLA